MDHDILLTYVMYYSLFNRKIFNNELQIMKYFPKNVFGVFTTIRRFNKISIWPNDIHGCIGYWNNTFNKLSKSDLHKNLLRVSYDAQWNDNRRQYFRSINTDPLSLLEIDFMLTPIYKVDKKTGIIIKLGQTFTNKTYGIIIQSKDLTRRATYLPGVFPVISWDELINSIKKKANITPDYYDNYEVFCYKILQIKGQFINLLQHKIFCYSSLLRYSRFLIDNMRSELKFPFPYLCKNNILEWNLTDEVRNISVLGDIIKYNSLYPNIISKEKLRIIKKKIIDILSELENYSSQSLSFLGHIFIDIKYNNFNMQDIKKRFCKKLLQDLPFAENQFEKWEIIIGLQKAGYKFKINKDLFIFTLNDSIFKMNWIIQSIISIGNKPSKELVNILVDKINNIIEYNKDIETNYIAVSFEALCFVYNSMNDIDILYKIFELFIELENRKKCMDILYIFQNKTARVDISGHVNNGFFELLQSIHF